MGQRIKAMKTNFRRSPVRWVLRQVEHVLAAVGGAFLLYSLTINISVVTSESMAPTLKGTNRENGDWVLTERVSYWLRRPRRWEIVTFENPESLQVMKRVVGLPGEAVSMEARSIRINGKPVAVPPVVEAIKYLPFGNLYRGRPCPCGDGYYVMGDDSADSQDSRFDGPLNRKKIMGRAWLIVWPPSRIGFLTPADG